MSRSPARFASLFVVLCVAALTGPARAEEAVVCCPYEDLGPGELGPGILDSCPGCRETRIYRSEILGRLWVRGEYLSWALSEQDFPALVAASLPGTPLEDAGLPGRPGTYTVFGGDGSGGGMLSGGRLTGGFWWHPDQMGGIEASYFELDNQLSGYRSAQPDALIGRPYLNVNTGLEDRLLVAYPDIQNACLSAVSSTTFNGAEALLRKVVGYSDCHRLDLLAGYRYSRLVDELQVFESLDPQLLGATMHVDAFDDLDVENQFHGGEVGAIMRWHGRYVGLRLLGKVALGGTHQRVTIDGGTGTRTTPFAPGSPTTESSAAGRLLALPTNIGSYSDRRVSGMGELGIAMEVALTCNCRATFGYTLIYWSNVARLADQLDLGVNPTQIPPGALVGARRPRFDLATSDFWAQGLNFGLEYQF